MNSPYPLKAPTLSFEFFPPKDDGAAMWQSLQALIGFNPSFASVTYGAGGSTRERTHTLVQRIRKETPIRPAAHLTCIGASRDEIQRIAEEYWNHGIKHIVALRGDAPAGETYQPHPNGYDYADALVEGLRRIADFEISVAAYPEVHPQALSAKDDLAHLKRKFDAGAHQAITQYFFETSAFERFIEQAAAIGINRPIVPGILPIGNFAQMVKFSAMCGANVPSWLHAKFEKAQTPESAKALAIEIATEQCQKLLELGATHLHFYTLNRADLVAAICENLGLKGSN